MSSPFDDVVETDVVIVGAGVAGLTTALGLPAELSVTVLSKADLGHGESSVLAQGGVAAAAGPDDSPATHAADTVRVAGGLADPGAVAVLTAGAVDRVDELRRLGVGFETGPDGRLLLGREAGHARARIAHAGGDATGKAIMAALFATAGARGLTVAEHQRIEALLLAGDRVAGVVAGTAGGLRIAYLAQATVLATGGIGHLYSRTTNPPAATGDGLALASWAGAALVDLEFVQFHPTVLDVDADPLPLLTEALRGAGAVLVDGTGRRFMVDEHPDAELAPRDVVARAIWTKLGAGQRVWLDLTGLDALAERFPTAVASCLAYGIDPTRSPVPVAPAAHYHMGGVATDDRGRSSLDGLWAVGEAACTGVHGANRLASNSLLEGLVFGGRAATDIADTVAVRRQASTTGSLRPEEIDVAAGPAGSAPRRGTPRAADQEPDWMRQLRRRMWDDVGLVRTESGLRRMMAWLDSTDGIADPCLATARLITRAAMGRPESRGGHYRADHPASLPAWQRRLVSAGDPARLMAVGCA